jgi:AsmA family protein
MRGLADAGESKRATGRRSPSLRIAAVVVAALLALGGAAAVALHGWGGAVVVWAIEHPVSAYIGRQLIVAGPVEVGWGAPTHLVLHDFRVANAPWGAAPEMLRAARVTVDIDPVSLIRGPVHFDRIAIAQAAVSLEIAKDGQHNWPTPQHPIPFIAALTIDDSAITFRRDATGATFAIDATRWRLDAPARDAAAQIALAGRFQGAPLAIKGTIGALAELRAPTAPYPVDLDATLAGSPLSAHGTVARPFDGAGIDLQVAITGNSVNALARALRLAGPALPDFRAQARVKGGESDWTFDDLRAGLGASDVVGSFAIDRRGAVPRLRARLRASRIDRQDVAAFFPRGGAPAPPAADGRIIPQLLLRPAWLGRADADIEIAAGQVALAQGVVLHDVTGALHAAGGVLTIDGLRGGAADGIMDANLRIDGTARPARVALDVAIHHLNVHKLVTELSLPDKVKSASGIAGGFARLTASGETLRAALGAMNGQVAVYAEDGRLPAALQQLAAFDVLKALGLAAASDVPAHCLIGVYDMADGIATSRATMVDTPETLSVGAGNFNFHDETIFFDVTPFTKRAMLFEPEAPVVVRGTFAAPAPSVSAMSLAGKIAAAAALAVLRPFSGEVLPSADLGLTDNDACARSFALVRQVAASNRR